MIAIIPAAGLGTRFLPVTRIVPKEMLPIGARPALELIVEEARAAGATRIVIIISHAKELIREYFAGQDDVSFLYQEEQRGLGHAVLQAADELGSEDTQALVLLGDALVPGCAAASEMIAVSRANGNASVIGCERVPRERVSRYGIMSPRFPGVAVREGESFEISDMIEKPSVEEAPSDLAVAGRYLLSATIFPLLALQTPGKGGEIQLTDAIRRMIRGGEACRAYVYPGKRQDIGNPDGYFKALEAYRANS